MTQRAWGDLLNDAKGQLEPVPDGTYRAKVVDSRDDKTQTGKTMFRVKFQIMEGPHAPRKVPTQLTVSDENPMALAIFFRQMEALGLGADFFSANPTNQQVADNLLNRECQIQLKTRQWQGVDRNEVAAILPPLDGGPVAPGTVTGVATPGGPTAPGASSVPTPATASTGPTAPSSSSGEPPLPF